MPGMSSESPSGISQNSRQVSQHQKAWRFHQGKRELRRPRLAKEGLGSPYASTLKRGVSLVRALHNMDTSWCLYYAEKWHLHTPHYFSSSINVKASFSMMGHINFSSNVGLGASFLLLLAGNTSLPVPRNLGPWEIVSPLTERENSRYPGKPNLSQLLGESP